MKKTTTILLALVAIASSAFGRTNSGEATLESGNPYTILSECDTTVKARLSGSFSFGSRQVRHIVYEYPSADADGKAVTISGVIMIPSDILDGSSPCDGVVMYNHYTLGSPEDAPSLGGDGLSAISAMLSNPLRPNYIIVASDYIGYGSSIDHNVSYISGDTNGRNALDGLLAARRLFEDRGIPQGKYLFNLGYSQGGTESMFAAKLTDTEEKYRGIRFDKTFSGGGPLDFEQIFTHYVNRDACDDIADVVLMLISVNENYHLGIDYKDMFKEPMASKALEYFKAKNKSVVSEIGVTAMDSIHEVLQPEFMNPESDIAKKFRAKLKEISLTEGWEPDITKNYYIEHSRHDNYVPIQSVRSIIPWMREKGFKPSIVPGKSSLQTCTVVFKLKHQQSGIVWAIQTMAAIQFWPVLYYEGEQNRYFKGVVGDMNLMKVIKTLESWGIDLNKIVKNGGLSRKKNPKSFNLFDLIPNIDDVLAKVDLTTDDLLEMCEDSGISQADIMVAYATIMATKSEAPAALDGLLPEDEEFESVIEVLPAPGDNVKSPTLEERLEAPLYLIRSYEQKLADWFRRGGFNVDYDLWGM